MAAAPCEGQEGLAQLHQSLQPPPWHSVSPEEERSLHTSPAESLEARFLCPAGLGCTHRVCLSLSAGGPCQEMKGTGGCAALNPFALCSELAGLPVCVQGSLLPPRSSQGQGMRLLCRMQKEPRAPGAVRNVPSPFPRSTTHRRSRRRLPNLPRPPPPRTLPLRRHRPHRSPCCLLRSCRHPTLLWLWISLQEFLQRKQKIKGSTGRHHPDTC